MTRSRLDSLEPELCHERRGLAPARARRAPSRSSPTARRPACGGGRSGPRSRPRARPRAAMSASPTLSRTRTGFWVRNRKPRIAFSSSAVERRGRGSAGPRRGRLQPLEDPHLALVRLALGLRAVPAGRPEPLEPSLGHGEVGQDELEVEPLDVAPWVDRALGVGHGRIVERPDDVEQGVGIAQPGEVLGRQLLGADPALARRLAGAGRSTYVTSAWTIFFGLKISASSVEPLSGHLDHADVELHAAEAAGLGVTAGEGVEDGRLARGGSPTIAICIDRLSPTGLPGVWTTAWCPPDSPRPSGASRSVPDRRVDHGSAAARPRRTAAGCRRTARPLRSRTRPLDHDVCGRDDDVRAGRRTARPAAAARPGTCRGQRRRAVPHGAREGEPARRRAGRGRR